MQISNGKPITPLLPTLSNRHNLPIYALRPCRHPSHINPASLITNAKVTRPITHDAPIWRAAALRPCPHVLVIAIEPGRHKRTSFRPPIRALRPAWDRAVGQDGSGAHWEALRIWSGGGAARFVWGCAGREEGQAHRPIGDGAWGAVDPACVGLDAG